MLEKDIQAAIIALLSAYHIPVTKINTAGIYVAKRNTYIKSHNVGMSDLYACLPPFGRSCWIEVKKKGNTPSQEQLNFIETINCAGGVAFVAYSIEDVQKELHEYLTLNNPKRAAAA